MNNDLISRAKLRQSLMIWADKLRTAGECGGCEVELLQAVVKMVDAQAAVEAEAMRIIEKAEEKKKLEGIKAAQISFFDQMQ